MEPTKRQISSEGCLKARKLEPDKGFNDFDILRNAYELLLENSELFWEELTIAFQKENEKAQA